MKRYDMRGGFATFGARKHDSTQTRMEFGRVPETELDHLDLSLPPDAASSKAVLKGKRKKRHPAIYTAAPNGAARWVGKLSPKGTKEKDYLAHCVGYFSSIEMNATHYRIFDVATVKKWKDTAPEGFVFCPKFYQGISHLRRLKNCDDLTSMYLESVHALEDKLGPSFLQLHENFGPKAMDDILNYLQKLPKIFRCSWS